jgi:hypothetical protein
MQYKIYNFILPVQQTIPFDDGTFFITFTCHNWLPLIDKTNGYKYYWAGENGFYIVTNVAEN